MYELLCASVPPAEIIRLLNYPRRTVYDIKKHFDAELAANGDIAEGAWEPSTARKFASRRRDLLDNLNLEFVRDLQRRIEEDPRRSIAALDIGVDRMTIRKYLKTHIQYKSYKMRQGQFMSMASQERRLDKAKKMLNKLKNLQRSKKTELIFLSDEKNFTQDQKINRQNNRWLCSDPKDVPVVMSTKFPTAVIVLAVISSKVNIMPPSFFERRLRVNPATYIDVMSTVVKPWMD